MTPSTIHDSIIMAVRVYFDGSGNEKDKKETYVSLACRAAPENIWKVAETNWCHILKDHFSQKKIDPPYYLHMNDAMCLSRSSIFSRDNGWNESTIDKMICELIFMFREFGPRNLVSVAASVSLAEYKEAKVRKGSDLLRLGTFLALRCCQRVFGSLSNDPLDSNSTIDIFHDCGERFLGDLKSDRRNKKIRRQQPILTRINGISEVDMKSTPGIQMADLLAWTVHRCLTTPEDGRAQDFLEMMRFGNLIDCPLLVPDID